MNEKEYEIIGHKYNTWTVIEYRGKNKNGKPQYLCDCDCGEEQRIFNIYSLKSGTIARCKYNTQHLKTKEMIGLKFGKLTVIKRSKYRGINNKEIYYTCECECGSVRDYLGTSLRRKTNPTKSCGCSPYKTHGHHNTRLYKIWDGMKYRCFNPNCANYHNYGGRGITICDEWLGENGMSNFYNWAINNGYEDNLTIDRINNDGNYEPSNCRWVDMKIQANNTRVNLYHTYNGQTKTVSEWAKEFKIYYATLLKRLERGYDIERALTETVKTPVKDRLVEIKGVKRTLIQWSEVTGINIVTLRVRYSRGVRGSELIKITNKMKLNKQGV